MKKHFKKILIISIVSVIVFIGLLFMQKNILNPNGVSLVVVATNEIEPNTTITSENINQYFIMKEIDNSAKLTNAITDKSELINKTIFVKLEKNEQITIAKTEENTYLSKLENPVEVSLRANDISEVVGGTLRTGDIINISSINSITKESKPILNNIYVDKAFATDGTKIGVSDTTSAITISVIIDLSEEMKLNSALAKGSIRISKLK